MPSRRCNLLGKQTTQSSMGQPRAAAVAPAPSLSCWGWQRWYIICVNADDTTIRQRWQYEYDDKQLHINNDRTVGQPYDYTTTIQQRRWYDDMTTNDDDDDNNTTVGRLAEEFVSYSRVNSVNNVMIPMPCQTIQQSTKRGVMSGGSICFLETLPSECMSLINHHSRGYNLFH